MNEIADERNTEGAPMNTTRSRLTCDCCDWRWDTQAELDDHVAYMNRYDTGEDYDMLADWWTVSRCPACGDPIDYCQGHGLIGDPVGHLTLQAHDKGRHEWCNAFGCEEVRLGK
jgi:hypothetical protein